MKDFRGLIFKKTFEDKNRMVLVVLNLSLVLFLVMFLITLGLNVKKNMDLTFAKSILHRQILVSVVNKELSDFEYLVELDTIENILYETTEEFYVLSVNNIQLSNMKIAHQYISNHDSPGDIGILIYGTSLNNENDILVSKQYLKQLSIVESEALGLSVTLSDGDSETHKKVVGIFDSSLFISQNQNFIILDTINKTNIASVVIAVKSVEDIEEIASYLKNNGFSFIDYSEEIKLFQNVSNIINMSMMFFGFLILLVSSIVLSNSTKVSIISKYKFLALLRSIGFTRNKLNMFVYAYLLFITVSSSFISLALYFLSLTIISEFTQLDNIFPLQQISLLSVNFGAVLITFGLSSLLTAYSSMKPVLVIRNLDVTSLFKEGVL